MTTEADRILALAAETTPGPWHLNGALPSNGLGHYWSCQPGGSHIRWDQERYNRDAAFITEVRTLAPVVAEQVKRFEYDLLRYANTSVDEDTYFNAKELAESYLTDLVESRYRITELEAQLAERDYRDAFVSAVCEVGHHVLIDDGDGTTYACPICALYEANERIEKALALHAPCTTGNCGCGLCSQCDSLTYPCQTVQALTPETEASDMPLSVFPSPTGMSTKEIHQEASDE